MNLQQLRYARAIAECGSFNEAAKRCCVTQPTLSNGLSLLEQELGRPLFTRTTRSVEITQFGSHILPSISDVLSAQEALLKKAHNLSHPKKCLLRIGVSPILSVRLVELIVEPFKRTNPDVDIIFREMNIEEMARLLDIGHLEFVLGPLDTEASLRAGWNSLHLYEEPLGFLSCGSNMSHMRGENAVTLKAISKQLFVMVPDTCGLTRITRSAFRKHRLKLKEYAGQAMSYGVLQEWASLGIGAAVLPLSKIENKDHKLLILDRNGRPLTISYHALWKAPLQNNSGDNPVITHLAEYLRHHAPSIIAGVHI